jgi:hypothetical protein
MNGGLGNDTYFVDNYGDQVFEFSDLQTRRPEGGTADNRLLLGQLRTRRPHREPDPDRQRPGSADIDGWGNDSTTSSSATSATTTFTTARSVELSRDNYHHRRRRQGQPDRRRRQRHLLGRLARHGRHRRRSPTAAALTTRSTSMSPAPSSTQRHPSQPRRRQPGQHRAPGDLRQLQQQRAAV